MKTPIEQSLEQMRAWDQMTRPLPPESYEFDSVIGKELKFIHMEIKSTNDKIEFIYNELVFIHAALKRFNGLMEKNKEIIDE